MTKAVNGRSVMYVNARFTRSGVSANANVATIATDIGAANRLSRSSSPRSAITPRTAVLARGAFE